MLVGVDAADLVEARRPNVAANDQKLLGAVARLRPVQLRVDEVHAQLEDRSSQVFNGIVLQGASHWLNILLVEDLFVPSPGP